MLDGGIGGQVVAGELGKRLGREHRVVIVEKSLKHVFSPSLLWVLAGWCCPNSVTALVKQI